MNAYLQPLSARDHDCPEIYRMVQEFPYSENGFLNDARGLSRRAFARWLVRQEEIARGEKLPRGFVRQSQYWLIVDGYPVGNAKLRHGLTPALRIEGGNIGYGIRPSARGRGYGTLILRLMLREAAKSGLERVLVTIHNDNEASLRCARAAGGSLTRRSDAVSYFWFDLRDSASS